MGNIEISELHLDILPESQRLLWSELKDTPDHFILYGGTAIALQLGHRQSVDFDFFAFRSIDPQGLFREASYLHDATVTQSAPNTLSTVINRNGSVKVSFFGLPNLAYVKEPADAGNSGIKIASLIDLADTKVLTIQQWVKVRDYIDIDALITKGGITLSNALAAAKVIYGKQFNPQITLKALSHFDELDLRRLPEDIKDRLLTAVRETDLDLLPSIQDE